MDFREVTENEDILENEDVVEETVVAETEGEEQEETNDYEDICYICRRPESTAGKMINIYGGVKICPDCMQRTMDAMNSSGFGMPPGMGFPGGPGADNANNNQKTPHIQMINLSDLNGMFGGFPGGGDMDGMFGGIPQSQRLKKKKKWLVCYYS